MSYIARAIGIVALGSAALMVGPAIAQTEGSQTGEASPTTQPAQSFSQEQLQSFAEARAAVRGIRQSTMKSMQQAEDQQAKAEMRQQAQEKMVAAVKDAGLTVQQYNQIARAARSNSQLARKIQQMQ